MHVYIQYKSYMRTRSTVSNYCPCTNTKGAILLVKSVGTKHLQKESLTNHQLLNSI